VDLNGYAELAVRLANAAASDEEEEAGGEGGHDISTLDGLRGLLTDLQLPDTRVTRSDLEAMQLLRSSGRYSPPLRRGTTPEPSSG
jgi:hypothetical protein